MLGFVFSRKCEVDSKTMLECSLTLDQHPLMSQVHPIKPRISPGELPT